MQKCQYPKSKTTVTLHRITNIKQRCFSPVHRHNWPLICSMFYFGWKFGPQSTGTTSSCILSGSNFRSFLICPADVIQQMIPSGTKSSVDWQPQFWIFGFCHHCNTILMYVGQKDLNKAHTKSTHVKQTSPFPKV